MLDCAVIALFAFGSQIMIAAKCIEMYVGKTIKTFLEHLNSFVHDYYRKDFLFVIKISAEYNCGYIFLITEFEDPIKDPQTICESLEFPELNF